MGKPMPSGTSKERQIKHNLELCKHRANLEYVKKYRTGEVPKKIKEKHDKEFTKAAYEADRISKR